MGIWDDYRRERRASWEDIAQAVRESVSMGDAVRMYCPDPPPRRNRIPCPIHQGKDYNFSFNDKGYTCFVCGESGDVIKFVQTICGLRTRADAMTKINCDFRLALPIEREITQADEEALKRRREAAREKERRRQEWEDGYHALWDEYVRLDRQRMFCQPCTDAWIEAVKNISRVAYEIDCYPAAPRE